jgi:hypothetical protein
VPVFSPFFILSSYIYSLLFIFVTTIIFIHTKYMSCIKWYFFQNVFYFICMWCVQKVSELFFHNFSGHACNLVSLISFKVLPSCIDTPLPTPLPLLETVLVRLFQDCV